MKAFKKYDTAAKYAGDLPIIAVGDLYIVSEGGDLGDMALKQISVLAKCKGKHGGHEYAGYVTVSKLAKLGNANWATPDEKWKGKVEIDWYGAKEKA